MIHSIGNAKGANVATIWGVAATGGVKALTLAKVLNGEVTAMAITDSYCAGVIANDAAAAGQAGLMMADQDTRITIDVDTTATATLELYQAYGFSVDSDGYPSINADDTTHKVLVPLRVYTDTDGVERAECLFYQPNAQIAYRLGDT